MENSRYIDREGTYICRVERPSAGWFGEAGPNETPFIRLPLRIKAQMDGGEDQIGRSITHSAWLSAKAFDKTIENLLKVFPQWGGDLVKLANNQDDFDGFDCEIVVEEDDYSDRGFMKVKWLNPAGGGGKAMPRAKVEGLVARLNAKSLALANAAPSPAPATCR